METLKVLIVWAAAASLVACSPTALQAPHEDPATQAKRAEINRKFEQWDIQETEGRKWKP